MGDPAFYTKRLQANVIVSQRKISNSRMQVCEISFAHGALPPENP
jgi:hypothetical protein